jgi:hypothetical protein
MRPMTMLAGKTEGRGGGAEVAVPGRGRSFAALGFGIGSVVLSSWMIGFFALVVVYFQFLSWTQISGQTWRTFVFHCNERLPLTIMLGCIGISATLGWLARRLVHGPSKPHSVGASAARFAKAGLIGAVLDALIVLYFVVYRFII